MMKISPKCLLSVQIINYKTKSYLLTCLENVLQDLKNVPFKWEINILDNNSGDDLSDLENKYSKKFPVHFFYSGKNLGFGGGHNFLAQKSQAKYLLILNPDIELIEKDTVSRLIQKIESGEIIKVVGPLLLTGDKMVPQWWDHGEIEGLLGWIPGNPYWKTHTISCKVAWVSGAVFLVEKEVFDKVGGFDENFFMYTEEVDLCLRIRGFNSLIVYDPNIKVFHKGGVVGVRKDYARISNDYFFDKHYKNKPYYWALKLFNRFFPYF